MLKKILDLPFVGQIVINKEKKMHEMDSELLRHYWSKHYKVDIGKYSYGGCFDPMFNTGGVNVTIGRYCSIAKEVRYFGANHPLENITTSPLFYNKRFGYCVNDVHREKLNIGNDVWIGYGVIITSSCSNIGNGAVIGAGSVVTHDVKPYSIVAGNPAKVIRMRFSENEIAQIETSRWWNKEPSEIANYLDYIKNPVEFISMICGK